MRTYKSCKPDGFSLIELLLVVAIILVIAAIAIPNFLRSRMAANEASAVGSLRTINTAETAYASTYTSVGFSTDLPSLSGTTCPTTPASTGACLIDSTLAAATTTGTSKSGYWCQYTLSTGAEGYTLQGNPAQPNWSGVRFFYTDSTNVIRYNVGSPATANDSAIE